MVVRWTFTDLSTMATHEMEVNPSDEDFPGWEKQFTYEQSTASGNTLVFEGRDRVRKGKFSGSIFTEAEFNTLYTWWDKRNQIRITDDLGRQQTVIFESFTPKRKRAHGLPWKHTYEMTYAVLAWS